MAKQITVEVNGRKYLLQHPGARASVQMRGRAKDSKGQMDEEKFYGELMKNVIIGMVDEKGTPGPRLTWDHFEEEEVGGRGYGEDLDVLMGKAAQFLMHIKDEQDTQG
jgi:hypothetical protein